MTAPTIVTKWRSWAPYLLSTLRIVAAFLFMQVGTAKLFGFPAPIMPGGGTAPAGSLPWFAGVLETFGGLKMKMPSLVVGLITAAGTGAYGTQSRLRIAESVAKAECIFVGTDR